MHGEAWHFLETALADVVDKPVRVLEFGSRDVNGSPRKLFTHPDHSYLGVDIEAGDGVDQVGNAAKVNVMGANGEQFDVVICAEVFEHTGEWPDILWNMGRHAAMGGLIVVTAATNPRAPHSAVDGWDLRDGEYYENVDDILLSEFMRDLFDNVYVTTHPRGDVYGKATAR